MYLDILLLYYNYIILINLLFNIHILHGFLHTTSVGDVGVRPYESVISVEVASVVNY